MQKHLMQIRGLVSCFSRSVTTRVTRSSSDEVRKEKKCGRSTFCPRVGITAACYRTEQAQIPKSAGESAGKSAGKKGTAGGPLGAVLRAAAFYGKPQKRHCSQQSPSSPLFHGTLPSTLPGTFGDLGFPSPAAGGRDSYPRVVRRLSS